jgi:hypothetical protein
VFFCNDHFLPLPLVSILPPDSLQYAGLASHPGFQHLTTNMDEALIQVLPLGQVTIGKLRERLKLFPQFHRIVAFRPTGWSEARDERVEAVDKSVVIYNLPYSEHSNFGELVLFLKRLRPRKIIPTVSSAGNSPKIVEALRTAVG